MKKYVSISGGCFQGLIRGVKFVIPDLQPQILFVMVWTQKWIEHTTEKKRLL